MWNFWYRFLGSSVVLATVLVESLISPLAGVAQPPIGFDSPLDVPLCYMRTATGKTLDLSHLCANAPSTGPANMAADASLIFANNGTGIAPPSSDSATPPRSNQCNYLSLDSQGRPCQ